MARGEYLATTFLISSERHQNGELILSQKKTTKKKQGNYPKTLIYMYGIFVAFEPTRATLVARGRNKGMNFRNVFADSEDPGTGDTSDGGNGAGRKLEFWHCGGEHLKINIPDRAEEKHKEKTQKEKGVEWYIRQSSDKCAYGKTEVKGRQLHMMFTPSVESTLGVYFSEMGECNKFTWHQFQVDS